ncbi:hypothetical protein V1509DRAFT_635786 [Lipomyces kononenkoae]
MFKQRLNLVDNEVGTEVLFTLQPLITSAKSVPNKWFRFVVSSFHDTHLTLPWPDSC